MKGHRLNGRSKTRSVTTFFLLVFLLSIPIWFMGAVAEQLLPGEMPTNLPISSLMACSPVIAAVILVRRQEGSEGVKTLLRRAFDYKRIKGIVWYVPILFLWPAMMVLEYGLMKLMGVPLSEPRLPVLMLPVSFAVFFVAALGEELGWQGSVERADSQHPCGDRVGSMALCPLHSDGPNANVDSMAGHEYDRRADPCGLDLQQHREERVCHDPLPCHEQCDYSSVGQLWLALRPLGCRGHHSRCDCNHHIPVGAENVGSVQICPAR
jgi:hypothetical protein